MSSKEQIVEGQNVNGGNFLKGYRDIYKSPLLSPESERRLGEDIEKGREAQGELSKGKNPNTEDIRAIENGKKAEETIVCSNSSLVISRALRYKKLTSNLISLSFKDLIQEGNLGLIIAAKKFNWRKGCKFSTYATRRIDQAIIRAMQDKGRTIRIPLHLGEQLYMILKVWRELEQQTGHLINMDQVIRKLGLTKRYPQAFSMALKATKPLSLEKKVTPHYPGKFDQERFETLGDRLIDRNSPSPEECVLIKESISLLRETINKKSKRDRNVIIEHFGLSNSKKHLSVSEISKKYGISQGSVTRIANKIFKESGIK